MQKPTRRSFVFAAALATSGLLVACEPGQPALQLPSDKSPASFLEALKAHGAGFVAGNAGARPAVYVVFDPQCPHCAAFWDMSRELRKTRQFVWVPIAMLRAPANRPQGATLLEAADPVALMEEHEKSLANKQGGIAGRGASEAGLAKVDRNTTIAKHFDIGGVPLMLVPSGSAVNVITGVPRPDQFEAAFR